MTTGYEGTPIEGGYDLRTKTSIESDLFYITSVLEQTPLPDLNMISTFIGSLRSKIAEISIKDKDPNNRREARFFFRCLERFKNLETKTTR